MRKIVLAEEDDDDSTDIFGGRSWDNMKPHPVNKEGITEYIARKREMFHVKYAISVKREEMRQLEKLAREEEKKLVIAEKCLEEDAITFDKFLKENDANSVESIRRVEQETRRKLEKVAAVKKLHNTIRGIETEISKSEERLKMFKKYRAFVDTLTPEEHRKPKKEKNISRKQSAVSTVDSSSQIKSTKRTRMSARTSVMSNRRFSARNSKMSVKESVAFTPSSDNQEIERKTPDIVESSSDEEEAYLYFNNPEDLLTLFHDLEDQNLSMIQNGQDMEEALDEMKAQAKVTEERLNREVNFLVDQIEMLEANVKRENEKVEDLELKCEFFSFGNYDEADQDKLVKQYDDAIKKVYGNIVGNEDAQIPTIHMVVSIENTLSQLLDEMENLPSETVAQYEKSFEKDRRARAREEKAREQEEAQKERVKRALERAQAAPRNNIGRKPVRRSEPPRSKAKTRTTNDENSKEQQEHRYFFEY